MFTSIYTLMVVVKAKEKEQKVQRDAQTIEPREQHLHGDEGVRWGDDE